MALGTSEARKVAEQLLGMRGQERRRLERIYGYMYVDEQDNRGQRLRTPAWLLDTVPTEVKKLAEIARVDMLPFLVRAAYQSLYVDGFRPPRAEANVDAWRAWQRNQFDKRQIGVHKAAIGYGKAYVTALPSDATDRVPVLRGASPRHLTAAYSGDDDMWPRYVLQHLPGFDMRWRLLDETCEYQFKGDQEGLHELEFVGGPAKHGMTWGGRPVCPVVRYRETDDLDRPVIGQVEPLMDLQDQINFTTFSLMVAQHFGAFKQRAIAGWLAETEQQKMQASIERLWTFKDKETKFHEFSETDLSGYLQSREASYRNLSTIAQQSPYELLGQLTNLSADALALADQSRRRAAGEHKTAIGESHEQMLSLAGERMGQAPEDDAEVRWRDTSVDTLSQIVDALGKAAQMLEIPPRALWERFADAIGASQTEIERWEVLLEEKRARDALMERLAARNGGRAGAGQP